MTKQTERLIAEMELEKKERTSERASIDFKFHYNTIGDCFYDIYCQPNCTKKEDLLKDMAGILNGELTADDFAKEIIRVLKINENVDWDFSDIPPKEEFKELQIFIKRLFKEYRGQE